MWRAPLLLTLAVAAGGCLFDDPPLCTLIGSPHGLNIEATVSDGAFADGVYDVIVRADGRELSIRRDNRAPGSCTATPPSSVSTWECLAEVDLGPHSLYLRAQIFADEGTIEVGYRGALGGPATAEVEVRRNDVTLITRTYTPAYQVVEPNGPGCGMSAYAFEALAIAAP